MNQRQAQQRNYQIMQLKGILPRIQSLIPKDIAEDYEYYDSIQKQANALLELIDSKKVKKFACLECCVKYGSKETYNQTTNKKAYKCDYCGCWDNLYLIK